MFKINIEISEELKKRMGHSSYDFFQRVYTNGLGKYETRLDMIQFKNKERILDAGCGFGQWLFIMAKHNKNVIGIDNSSVRVETCNELIKQNKIKNVRVFESGIQKTLFPDEHFDAIFCYSAIYFTDYEKTLTEFYRVLKRNGVLYLGTNSWGKYIFDLFKNPHASYEFSARKYAIHSVFNTLLGKKSNFSMDNGGLIMASSKTRNIMKKIGFKDIISGPDGTINFTGRKTILPFLPESYFGLRYAFEVHAIK